MEGTVVYSSTKTRINQFKKKKQNKRFAQFVFNCFRVSPSRNCTRIFSELGINPIRITSLCPMQFIIIVDCSYDSIISHH